MPDGKPNLTGLWQAITTADWNVEDHSAQAGPFFQLGAIGAIPPGQSIVEGGSIPYKPEALIKRNENFANRLKLDPEIKCYMPGLPRAMTCHIHSRLSSLKRTSCLHTSTRRRIASSTWALPKKRPSTRGWEHRMDDGRATLWLLMLRDSTGSGSYRANGSNITFPDGKKLFLGSSGTGAPFDPEQK